MEKYFIDYKGIDDSKNYADPYDCLYELLEHLGIEQTMVFGLETAEHKTLQDINNMLLNYFIDNKTIVPVFEQQEEDSYYSYWDSMYEARNNY